MTRKLTERESAGIAVTDVLLIIAYIAAVMPFLTMFVWNTLVSGMFGVMTIGYGGAWAIVVIRAFFFKTMQEPKDSTPEESLSRTIRGYVYAAIAAIATLIIGLSLGYL